MSGSGGAWSISATVAEDGSDHSHDQTTTHFEINDDGQWEPTTSSGSGSASSVYTYSASGSYWYSLDEGTASGTFTDSATNGVAYDYWYLVGQTTVIGTFTDEANDHMTYSYLTTSTAVGGVWTYGGSGLWTKRLRCGRGERSVGVM